ncbi:MAG: universal stress protein, partial [bacterium]|nr:universal stress protein [bacterium]
MKSRNVVVVGVDGSPESLDAVEWAAREAAREDYVLRIVHVWHLPSYSTEGIAATVETDHGLINAAVTVAVSAVPSIRCDLKTPSGPAALTLLGECT